MRGLHQIQFISFSKIHPMSHIIYALSTISEQVPQKFMLCISICIVLLCYMRDTTLSGSAPYNPCVIYSIYCSIQQNQNCYGTCSLCTLLYFMWYSICEDSQIGLLICVPLLSHECFVETNTTLFH